MKEEKHSQYPFRTDEEKKAFWKRAGFWKLRSRTFPFPVPRLHQARFKGIEIIPVSVREPPPSDALILIVTTYNSMHEIAKFFKHYRKLGIERFVAIDDGSDDGTLDFLCGQPDADVYRSNVPFGKGRDRIWRQLAMEKYGKDRWYMSVDSDEYLVFENSETKRLPDLIREMEQNREWHLAALMIDLYPDGPVDSVADDSARLPWHICPMFDPSGYFIRPQARALSIRGGPRYRHFGFAGRINKYPLFYADRSTRFDLNYHTMFPYYQNFVPVRAALLHNKYAPGAISRLGLVAQRGHHNGSDQGPLIAEDFRYAGSQYYTSSMQLVELGLIERAFG